MNQSTGSGTVSTPGQGVNAYQKPQFLGNGVARAKRSLPNSPRKRTEVVKRLAAGESLIGDRQPRPLKEINDETKEAVVKFYTRNDISRQAPGMRDPVIIRSPAVKEKIQKRHLVMTVLEAHRCFQDEHPDLKISKSLQN